MLQQPSDGVWARYDAGSLAATIGAGLAVYGAMGSGGLGAPDSQEGRVLRAVRLGALASTTLPAPLDMPEPFHPPSLA